MARRGSRLVVGIGTLVAVAAALAAVASSASGRSDAAPPIVIGSIASIDGPFANIATAQAAVEAWARGVNARGGLGTRHQKIKLIFCNTKDVPNLATACARQMVTSHAAAVIGSDTINDPLTMPILAAAHIPNLANGGAAPLEFTSPYSYPLDNGGYLPWEPLIVFSAKKLHDRVAWFVIDVPIGRENGAIVENDIKSQVKFTGTVFVPPTTADFAPVVQQAKQGNPTSIALFTASPQAGAFVRAAAAANAGFNHYLWQGVDMSIFATVPDSARDKVISASPVKPVSVLQKEHNAMLKRMVANLIAYKKETKDANGDPARIIPQTFLYYLGGVAIERVTNRLATINAATLKTALDKAKNIDLGGIMPPWTPSKPGPTKQYRRISNMYQYLLQYHANSGPTLLWPNPVTPAMALAGDWGKAK
jgi:ABC-type branched-subunit amino acid transport system substrate-binding protein